VFYSATMSVNAVAWIGVWLHAARGRHLLGSGFPEHRRRITTWAFTGGGALYLVPVGLAFANAYLCLGFHALLAVYYASDPVSRLTARAP
jgi:hypothetical protein